MLERLPFEYFIKYLISKGFEVPVVASVLRDHGLYGGVANAVTAISNKMEMPTPFVPTEDKGSKADFIRTKDWLRREKIKDLWYPNKSAQEAYLILAHPELRENVQQLLLSPLRIENVVSRINSHHKSTLTVDGLRTFGHYFWNRNLLSMGEWVEYLNSVPGSKRAKKMLRVSPDMADMVVPWLSGMSGMPTNLHSGTIARRMRDLAFMKVLEIEQEDAGMDHSKTMKNYMDVIRGAESELRQSDVALKDVLGAFEKFHMKTDESRVPSIEEVAGPNYSHSGEGTDGDEEKKRDLLGDT